MAVSDPISDLVATFVEIGRDVSAHDDGDEVLSALTEWAVRGVPGAEHAGITIGGHSERFETVAATSEVVRSTDQIQYELGHGPCVDAILESTVFNAADLRTDERWPQFGRRAFEATGIVSMLSLRMFFEDDVDLIAGMNMYARTPAAFGPLAESLALLVATHGALAVANVRHREKAGNLIVALRNSRTIGIAMGVLMNQRRITDDQAFDLLRIVSQHTHRKLSDIAAEVAQTGALPELPNGKPGSAHADTLHSN
jgi:hypothetical protein